MIGNIKLKDGISLIVLIITIVVILILLTTITISADNIINNNKKKKFAKEMYEVQSIVDKYKYENNDYPYIIENDEKKTITININNILEQFSDEDVIDDTVTLYQVSLSKVEIQNLSLGTEKNDNVNDVYAFSQKTGKVYYVKGYKVSNITYYTLTDELKALIGLKTKDSENSNIKIVSKINLDGYIRDGLILYYDGINNTREGNNLNATKWEDLSGNNNDGIFVNPNNTITYMGNGYEFTNNDDYIETINNLGVSSAPDITLEFVHKSYGVKEDSNTTNACGLFTYGSATGGSSDIGKILTGNVTYPLSTFSVINNLIKCNIQDDNNVVRNIVFTTAGSTFPNDNTKIYQNGEKLEIYQKTGNISINLQDSTLQIGREWQYNQQENSLNGIIYAVRVYDRVLTEEEIRQNYEIDKLRFNID